MSVKDIPPEEITECAMRILGELMLQSPGNITTKTNESLACAVALYIEQMAKHHEHGLKGASRDFKALIDSWQDAGASDE